MTENTSPIARFLVVSAAFVIVVSGLKMAGSLLVPFLLAVFIAMIVSPLLNALKNRGMPGGISILVIVLLILLVGLGLMAVVGSSVRFSKSSLSETLWSMCSFRTCSATMGSRCGIVIFRRFCRTVRISRQRRIPAISRRNSVRRNSRASCRCSYSRCSRCRISNRSFSSQ